MTKERFKSAKRMDVDSSSRRRKPPAIFKDLIEKPSVLIGTRDANKICRFISNSGNDKNERVQAITSLENAVLIPDTYDAVQATLSRLSREDPSEDIKAVSGNVFTSQREKCLAAYKFKKVV